VEEEIWKDIPGYEGLYQVSNLGRVKSLSRLKRCGRSSFYEEPDILLKPKKAGAGRLYVSLYKNGKRNNLYIHRLVLITFVGPCPQGMECCHYDDNPLNNRLDNLRWDTHKNNVIDRINNDKQVRGSRSGVSILTEQAVTEIKKILSIGGYKIKEIAKKYGVAMSTISEIKNGNNWKHITLGGDYAHTEISQ